MSSTDNKFKLFAKAIQKKRDIQEEEFQKAVSNQEKTTKQEIFFLSDKLNNTCEMLAMFEACFYREIESN